MLAGEPEGIEQWNENSFQKKEKYKKEKL